LDRLKPGNEITLRTPEKSYTYKVEEVRIVKPTDLGVLEQTPDAVLTLISCYPYLIDTQRIVVRASLATEAPS
jgi:sortase A